MGLDLRWPIGLMFSLIGVLMTITGLVTRSQGDTYKRSMGININLWWGLFLVVFGLFMLFLAWRGAKRAQGGQQQQQQQRENGAEGGQNQGVPRG